MSEIMYIKDIDKIFVNKADENRCLHKTCGQRCTHFVELEIHGELGVIPLCAKHADLWQTWQFERFKDLEKTTRG